jgi:DNA gyrase/topoisomerase IV subunit A
VTTFRATDAELDAVLDLVSPGLSRELSELEGRLRVLNGSLDALSRLPEVNEVIQFSRDRASALVALQEEPFCYSTEEAEAILDMPMSWQSGEHAEDMRKEREVLTARRASLREHVADGIPHDWFG